jgi:hypothetical protein
VADQVGTVEQQGSPDAEQAVHQGSPDRVMVLSFFPMTASTNATAQIGQIGQIGQMVSILNFALGVADL